MLHKLYFIQPVNLTIKLKLAGLSLLLLYGCKTKTADFMFDLSKMNHLVKYQYEYVQGRKTLTIRKDYVIMFGQVADSMITKTIYEYNSKGQIIKEISKTSSETEPDTKLYIYNTNDSLTSELTINPDGDTTHINSYGYFPDGRKNIFRRDLFLNPGRFEDIKKARENKLFDTILFRREYLYENNICKHMKEYGKRGTQVSQTDYKYDNGKLSKEDLYSVTGELKILIKTKYYDYSGNRPIPDFYTLDENSDTVDFKTSVFDGEEQVYSADSHEKGNATTQVFYKNSRETGRIGINRTMNFKLVTSTSYYDNGDIKEERSFSGKANDH